MKVCVFGASSTQIDPVLNRLHLILEKQSPIKTGPWYLEPELLELWEQALMEP